MRATWFRRSGTTRHHTHRASQKPEILFHCVHNAGRSQMGAGFARRLGGERVVIHSAGTAPGDQLNPAVIAVMNGHRHHRPNAPSTD